MTGQQRQAAALRDHLTDMFGMAPESILTTSPHCAAPLEMARIRGDQPNTVEVFAGASEPGFLVSVQLGELHTQRVHDGSCWNLHVYNRDSINIQYLRGDYKVDLLTPFDFAVCYIPCEAINIVAQEMGADEVTPLACKPATCDPVVGDLCRALLPALYRGDESQSIFVDSAAAALISHLALTYGAVGGTASSHQAGLGEWQTRRAIELLTTARNLSITDIAAECGLSRSYFARAFKKSTGLPPQRWLAAYRLRKARHLLS